MITTPKHCQETGPQEAREIVDDIFPRSCRENTNPEKITLSPPLTISKIRPSLLQSSFFWRNFASENDILVEKKNININTQNLEQPNSCLLRISKSQPISGFWFWCGVSFFRHRRKSPHPETFRSPPTSIRWEKGPHVGQGHYASPPRREVGWLLHAKRGTNPNLPVILLMEEIPNNHLGSIKSCK